MWNEAEEKLQFPKGHKGGTIAHACSPPLAGLLGSFSRMRSRNGVFQPLATVRAELVAVPPATWGCDAALLLPPGGSGKNGTPETG